MINVGEQIAVIHVGGDGSHLAIVDTDQYKCFVGNWGEENRLRKHLQEQTKRETMGTWGTGVETDWKLAIKTSFSNRQGYREFESVITTQSGRLYLINYDSLTMAAQFEDYTLPMRKQLRTGSRLDRGGTVSASFN